jgi:basic membrane protein A and related proteins
MVGCICGLLGGCSKKEAPKETKADTPAVSAVAQEQRKLVVGFVYVGAKDDFGYNQAHAEAAKELAKDPGIKVLEQEKVEETKDVQDVMVSMINDDHADILFPTSFGYFDPHILKVADKYPDKIFLHCGGLYQAGKHPKNVGSYFGYIDEAQYLDGIIAAYTSKTKKLGFIAAKPIPQVLRNINAFTLGARSVDPKITTTVVFTGGWQMTKEEAEATNSLIGQGIDVLAMHVDSPKVIVETAEKQNVYVTGYHTSQAALAPKGYLSGAEWNWTKVYTYYINAVKAGKLGPDGVWEHVVRGGLKDGFVKTSPYGAAVGEPAKKAADDIKAKMMGEGFVIFKGPLKDNKGKVIIAEGQQQIQTDPVLEQMGYLVEGVVGSTGAE